MVPNNNPQTPEFEFPVQRSNHAGVEAGRLSVQLENYNKR
jgi:hypothetical protein